MSAALKMAAANTRDIVDTVHPVGVCRLTGTRVPITEGLVKP